MLTVMIVSFFAMILFGVPIAFAMGTSALTFILVDGTPLTVVAQRFFANTQSFAFLAIPFFILTGSLMVHGQIAQKIVNLADSLVRHLPGGLACVNVVTNMGMAGVSGSSDADASAVGSVLIPEMKKKGYPASFSASVNAASAVMGIIIPPSSTMIIIAWLTNLSVGEMFLAGVIPGLLIGTFYLTVTVLISKKRGYPRRERATFLELLRNIADAFWAIILPILLIVSIVFGFATPTEAAALSSVYAFVVGFFIYRTLDAKKIFAALKETVYATSVVMLIICTSNIFTDVLIRERIPQLISDFLLGLGLSNWLLTLALVTMFLIAGLFVDIVPNLFLFIPIAFPIATGIGMDPMLFSIVMLCSLAIGLFTPPVGTTLFISCHLANVGIEETRRDLVPYFVTGVAVVLLVAFIPPLTLWLPGLLK